MGAQVLGTLDDLDLGSEGDLGADLEAGALVCLDKLQNVAPQCCVTMLH